MSKPEHIEHLQPLARDYDLYILDQWGVLHDGAKVHPGAAEAMAGLKAAGKTIILVSNSSRRIPVSIGRLTELGIAPELYDHILTSGELAWDAIKTKSDPLYRSLGPKCVVIGKDRREDFLEGLTLEVVDDVAAADFLLVGDLPDGPLEALAPMLAQAAARGLPMVVLNPDFHSVDPNGKLSPCPGQVGRAYEKAGGTVKTHGKPNRSVYDICFQLATDPERALAIGDSLHHDIAGANGASIDSVFITSGIHAFELETTPSAPAEQEKVEALCREIGQTPTYWSTRFVW